MTTRIRSEAARFLPTLVWVLVASSPAFAASLTVGIDGGTPGEPPTAVAPDHGMRVAEIYLNLDTASQEEASGFDGLFEVVFSGFDWSFGGAYPDWGYCASNTYTRGSVAKVSCISNNLGGERLVASFDFIRTGSDPSDVFAVIWTEGLATRDTDEFPFSTSVPISTTPGTVLFLVPEPSTTALFVIGLGVAWAFERRRKQ